MKKIPFEEVNYDPDMICWGRGNNAVGPQLLARIRLREPNSKEDKKAKKDWEDAKAIYDKYINKGQRFKPWGKTATRVTGVFTFINAKKHSVTWKQDNLTEDEIKEGYKPAAGKFSISALIRLYRNNEIKFI